LLNKGFRRRLHPYGLKILRNREDLPMRSMLATLSTTFAIAIATLAPGQSRAASLATLVTFNRPDGIAPFADLMADANGNLFGTTQYGGANGNGTVFEIAKTAGGYASTPRFLYSFCAQTGCADGARPRARLLADASGNVQRTGRGFCVNRTGT
jgi:uncharacterized repeat protein (TIGR03803 family)